MPTKEETIKGLSKSELSSMGIPFTNEQIRLIRKLAKERINKCKDKCYYHGRYADNGLEGDYGTWRQWENVLVDFAKIILQQKNK